MRNDTETLVMFAQLLETQPPILPPDRAKFQELAAKLADISETDAADIIIEWLEQFPQEQEIFVKELAKNRQELGELAEPDSNQMQWIIPNFQIIEEKETMILPPGREEKVSLLAYVRQKLTECVIVLPLN
jgi:16S rRNA C967 or C1407 C5-methylase (RsmB/RsmF family)